MALRLSLKNKRKRGGGFIYNYVTKDETNSIKLFPPGTDLIPLNPKDVPILEKFNRFMEKSKLHSLNDAILPRTLFGIESNFVENNPQSVEEYREGASFDRATHVKLLANDKAGARGRSKWFIVDKKLIKQNIEYISQWQVVVSSAHAGGQHGRDNQAQIIDSNSVFGRARVALKSFTTEQEAINFLHYIQCNVIRYALLMTDESLSSVAKKVPDILDYSSRSPWINFSEDIDQQLCDLIKLTSEEYSYILQLVQHDVKEMD